MKKDKIERKNLFAELQQLPMSKTAICEALKISPRTLDGYLAGRSIPSKTLVALRNLTGKTVQFLLDLPTYD